MPSLKRSDNTLLVILSSLGIFLFFLVGRSVYINNEFSFAPQLKANEDSESQIDIPTSVQSVVSEAKSKGLPVLGVRADGPSYKIPVLMYHYVENVEDKRDINRIAMNVSPSLFDSQLKTLVNAGYTFMTPSELADVLDGIKEMPSKPIIISFDDGHRDFYLDAFPILKKYNVKSVQYVITGFLGYRDFLTKEQLSEISKSGIVEIGAHTVDHLALSGLKPDVVKKQIVESKIMLESFLGVQITTFAYPYGSFDLTAMQAVKTAGFRTAFSTVPGIEAGNYNRLFINRLRPGGATGQGLINLVENKHQ